MEIQYRIARPEDFHEICSLFQNTMDGMLRQNILQWDALYPNEEVLWEDVRKRQLRVGTVDGQIVVAYVLNQEYEDKYQSGSWKFADRPFCILHRLCVDPRFLNHGIGRVTMLHAEEDALSMGFQAIRLDAFSENPFALKLYGNRGYSRAGHADRRKGRFYLMEKYL